MENIIQMVSSVGFPIAACIGIGWYCKYMTDKFMSMIGAIEQKYTGLIQEQQDVISNNTQALTVLTEKISSLQGGKV